MAKQRPTFAGGEMDRVPFWNPEYAFDNDADMSATYAEAVSFYSQTYGLVVSGFPAYAGTGPPVVYVDMSANLSAQGNPSACDWSLAYIIGEGFAVSAYSGGTADLERTAIPVTLPEGTDLTTVAIRVRAFASGSNETQVRVFDVYTGSSDYESGPTGRQITLRSYWKRFMSRNPNYKGRLMEIYEGQVGMAEGEFTRTWVGKLTNVTTQNGEFTFESTDLLKDLSTIDVPLKLDIKLAADLSWVEAGQITLTSVEGLGSGAGYIRIKDEIIGYATLNVTTKALQTLTRGAFGTAADEYKARDKVQAVRFYAPANPWDILLEMLRVDAGIADADIDLDAFALAKRTPGNDKLFRAVLSEPENLDKLFFEITDILDAKAWVGEDLRITIQRNVQNAPGRAYYRMTDGANIVDNSASVDFNEKSRLTRMLIYWHKSVLGKKDDPAAFDRLDIAVDADAEASYGDVVEKKVFCRWIDPIVNEEDSAETYVKNLGMRQVRRSRDAQPLIALSLSLRDLAIKTGDHVRLDTDELVKFNGDPITNEIFQVVKRELQDDFSLKVSLLRVSTRRMALIAPNGYPNYRDAADEQKEYGFITLDTGFMENEDQGYYIW